MYKTAVALQVGRRDSQPAAMGRYGWYYPYGHLLVRRYIVQGCPQQRPSQIFGNRLLLQHILATRGIMDLKPRSSYTVVVPSDHHEIESSA